MFNDLFSIGPFTAHTYGLMIAIGVYAALFIAERRAPKNGTQNAADDSAIDHEAA